MLGIGKSFLSLRPTAETQRDFAARIKAMVDLTRPTPALTAIIQRAVLDGFEENFASESAGGVRWAALSAWTIRERLSQGYGEGPILVRSGDYRASWINEGHPHHVHEVMDTGMGWTVLEGSEHPKAEKLEGGDGRTPARPVAVLSAQAQDHLRREIDLYVFRFLTLRG